MYKNKKNGRIVEVLEEDKKYKTVLIQFQDTEEEQQISTSTLKRWYEPIEDDEDEDYEDDEDFDEDDEDLEEDDDEEEEEEEEEDEEDSDDEDDEDEDDDSDEEEDDEESEDEEEDDEDEESEDEDDEEDEEEEEEEEPTPKKSSKKSVKKERTPRKKSEESDTVKELVDYVEECVKEQDGEIFQPQSQPRNRAFKVGGHMYARLLYSVKSVTVACRKEAVSGTGIKPTKSINHMFSELYSYDKLDKTAKTNIKKLLKASFEYQLKKNQSSDKVKAKKEKAAPKKEAKTSTKSKATGKKNSKKEK